MGVMGRVHRKVVVVVVAVGGVVVADAGAVGIGAVGVVASEGSKQCKIPRERARNEVSEDPESVVLTTEETARIDNSNA